MHKRPIKKRPKTQGSGRFWGNSDWW